MNAISPRTTRATPGGSLAPTNLTEAMRFSEVLASSSMVPTAYQGKPGNVLVAIQWGNEIGLGPMQALQNIAVIQGRPSLWGDAMLGLVQGHPAYAGHREWIEGEGDERTAYCAVQRRGSAEHVARFSVAMAKEAGLWNKAGPWKAYPERMLQMRARGFALRDTFADALRGIISREEAEDIPPPPRDVPNVQTQPARPATPGGLLEHVQQTQGVTLPMVRPDTAALVQIKEGAWLKALTRAVSVMESAEALREWRASMGTHLAAVSETRPDLVAQAEAEIARRMAEFSPAEDDRGDAWEEEEVEA